MQRGLGLHTHPDCQGRPQVASLQLVCTPSATASTSTASCSASSSQLPLHPVTLTHPRSCGWQRPELNLDLPLWWDMMHIKQDSDQELWALIHLQQPCQQELVERSHRRLPAAAAVMTPTTRRISKLWQILLEVPG